MTGPAGQFWLLVSTLRHAFFFSVLSNYKRTNNRHRYFQNIYWGWFRRKVIVIITFLHRNIWKKKIKYIIVIIIIIISYHHHHLIRGHIYRKRLSHQSIHYFKLSEGVAPKITEKQVTLFFFGRKHTQLSISSHSVAYFVFMKQKHQVLVISPQEELRYHQLK